MVLIDPSIRISDIVTIGGGLVTLTILFGKRLKIEENVVEALREIKDTIRELRTEMSEEREARHELGERVATLEGKN